MKFWNLGLVEFGQPPCKSIEIQRVISAINERMCAHDAGNCRRYRAEVSRSSRISRGGTEIALICYVPHVVAWFGIQEGRSRRC